MMKSTQFLAHLMLVVTLSSASVKAQFGFGLGDSPLGSLIRSASPFSSPFTSSAYADSEPETQPVPMAPSSSSPDAYNDDQSGVHGSHGPQRPMQWSPSQGQPGPYVGQGYDDMGSSSYRPASGRNTEQNAYHNAHNQRNMNSHNMNSMNQMSNGAPRNYRYNNKQSNVDDEGDDEGPSASPRHYSSGRSAANHDDQHPGYGISDIGTAASRPSMNDENYDSPDSDDNAEEPPIMRGTDQFGASPSGSSYTNQADNNRRQAYGGYSGYGFADPSAMGLDLSGLAGGGNPYMMSMAGMQPMNGGQRVKSASSPMQQGYYGMKAYGYPNQQSQRQPQNNEPEADNFNDDNDDD